MTKSSVPSPDDPGAIPSADIERDVDYCFASGLRRKFLDFCDENPAADECQAQES